MDFSSVILLTLHAALAAVFPKWDTCAHCDKGEAGLIVDVGDWSSCDDCFRRSLALRLSNARGIWLQLRVPSAKTNAILDRICAEKQCVYSYELQELYRAGGLHSGHLPLDKDSESKSAKGVRSKFALNKDPVFMGIDVTSLKDGPTSDSSWKWFYEQLIRSQHFLTEELFVEFYCNSANDEHEEWSKVDPESYFFEYIDEVVSRRIIIGKSPSNSSEAFGVSSVISSTCVPALQKDGKLDSVNYVNSLSREILDDSYGVTVDTNVDGWKLRDEFAKNAAETNNLFYTLALHCSAHKETWGVKLSKRKCQLHCVGQRGDVVQNVSKESWVPLSFARKGVPSKLLAHVRPYLEGVAQAMLTATMFCASLGSYLASEARRVATPYTSLIPAVQQVLLSKYPDPSKIPENLATSLIGQNFSNACSVIFNRPPDKPLKEKKETTQMEEVLRRLDSLSAKKTKTTNVANKAESGSKKPKFSGYPVKTKKQGDRLVKSFGGDFKKFLIIKKRDKLRGKLDLLKLSNFYQDGKQDFGEKTLAQVKSTCSLN